MRKANEKINQEVPGFEKNFLEKIESVDLTSKNLKMEMAVESL